MTGEHDESPPPRDSVRASPGHHQLPHAYKVSITGSLAQPPSVAAGLTMAARDLGETAKGKPLVCLSFRKLLDFGGACVGRTYARNVWVYGLQWLMPVFSEFLCVILHYLLGYLGSDQMRGGLN